jgi:starch phosphorylase
MPNHFEKIKDLQRPAAENPQDNLEILAKDIHRHIVSNLGNEVYGQSLYRYFNGLALSIRDRLIRAWLNTQESYYDSQAKRVYYLSLEFLPGRFLMNCLTNLGLEQDARKVLEKFGLTLEDVEEVEWDAGLGNGGLGRLASCYLDSMASLKIPGYGYGILYDYGIFFQNIVNGFQEESCDNWRRQGSPWEIIRREHLYEVKFYGRSEVWHDEEGRLRFRWADTEKIMAVPCDILIPGYGGGHVSNMRLWAAQSSREFNLSIFNRGDYAGAMYDKIMGENISKVLYPNDQPEQGKELRLKQQYFLVAATFQDIVRRHKKHHGTLAGLPDYVAVQLNDTHPAIAVAELMRILLDEELMSWEEAWETCRRTFAYTNHTVLPEALETWPVNLIGNLLPRHLEIIYEINRRFLEDVAARYPGDGERLARLSLIAEGQEQRVRMAHLAIVGSHSVNGVAALHTRILQDQLFKDFDQFYPGKFRNVTNGVTPRRWLLQANPALSRLINETIGSDWVCDLSRLKKLIPLADDPQFRKAFADAKLDNKKRLARYVLRRLGLGINPRTLFDCQFKRIHEYKRQLLNILQVITRFNRLKAKPDRVILPRTVLMGGKAAPGYYRAKLIIKLFNAVAEVINNDPDVAGRLRMLFLPNYCISQAEKVIPAADLSEQISTAGMEASGTGNMKFAINGALTIGTLDGANVEMREEVGPENFFLFGLTAEEVTRLRREGYNPRYYYERDHELKQALDQIASGYFCPSDPHLFAPLVEALLQGGDYFLVLADYRSYLETQDQVDHLFGNPDEWTRKAILNTANMGKFSSDRAILEYARHIWGVRPLGEV